MLNLKGTTLILLQSPALHIAIHSGNIDVARELLNHGADPNSSDWEGDTPLTIAGRSGAVRTVQINM